MNYICNNNNNNECRNCIMEILQVINILQSNACPDNYLCACRCLNDTYVECI